jgi:hypothetical protein
MRALLLKNKQSEKTFRKKPRMKIKSSERGERSVAGMRVTLNE